MNKALFKELQQGKRQHYEMIKQLKRRDGTGVWMQLYLFALRDEVSGVQRIFIMNLDITDHKQAQDGLEEARTELARVGRINRMGIMAASIAHEIKQPLAAITAQAAAGLRWLGRAVPDLDETRAALQHIVRDGQRAAETVEGIRAMFKEERRSLGAIDLNQLVQDVLVLAREEIQKRLIVVETYLTDNLPPVWGDRVQLQQVMFNLVTNAADSMDSVGDRPRILRLKSELDGTGVIVAVEDSGTGIAPENIDRIFDTFFTTKPQGMGMGLSICRSIIESHAGRLSVLPSYQGAIFQVALPVDRSKHTFQTH
jgi:C4-dicarboxylate-specific signal transduction histidine kinase